jgi:hypothetical protein
VEAHSLPSRGTEPTLHATDRGPQTPPAQLADHETTTRLENARDFTDGSVGLSDKAEYRDRDDSIEGFVLKGQCFGASSNEVQLDRFALSAAMGRGEHLRIRIEPGDVGSATRERGSQNTVTAADIEHA